MINSIQLKNFQCHDSLDLSFTGGVNVIVGSSDKGKSAILRALRLALWNNLSGDGYVKHGKTSMSITVDVDGHEIIRSRKGKTNEYQVDGTVLKAIGMSPLDQVTDIHRIHEEISFQGQHDAAFMVSWSPTNLLQTLNSIVGLDSIDKALSIAKSEYQEMKDKVLSIEKDLKSLKEQRDSLSSVPKQIEDLKAIQVEVFNLEAMDTKFDSIGRLIYLITEVDKEISVLSKKEKLAEDLSIQYSAQDALSQDVKRLKAHVTASEEIVQYRAKEMASSGIVEMLEKQIECGSVIEKLRKVTQDFLRVQRDIVCMNEQDVLLLEEGKKFNGNCPECGKDGFIIG